MNDMLGLLPKTIDLFGDFGGANCLNNTVSSRCLADDFNADRTTAILDFPGKHKQILPARHPNRQTSTT